MSVILEGRSNLERTIALPDFVEKHINKLSDETKVNTDTLRAEYIEILSDPFIQNDSQFVTDSQRHGFTLKVLIAHTRTAKLDSKGSEEYEGEETLNPNVIVE